MWQIFKAEVSYNKAGFLIAYVLAFIIQIGGLYPFYLHYNAERSPALDIQRGGFFPQLAALMIIFFIIVGMMGSQSDKEKRDRLHSLLPIPIKKLAFIRLTFVIIFQLGFVAILVSHFFIAYFGKDNSAFWSILVANGFILSVINVFIIYTELGFFNKKRYRFTFLGIIIGILNFIALGLFLGYLRSFVIGPEFGKTPIHALIFNGIALGMLYLSYTLFIRRKSYLA